VSEQTNEQPLPVTAANGGPDAEDGVNRAAQLSRMSRQLLDVDPTDRTLQ